MVDKICDTSCGTREERVKSSIVGSSWMAARKNGIRKMAAHSRKKNNIFSLVFQLLRVAIRMML
jgi:hypothetical protein